MKKGRKALAGTYEARDYVNKGHFVEFLKGNSKNIASEICIERIVKAVKFGLGIKEPS